MVLGCHSNSISSNTFVVGSVPPRQQEDILDSKKNVKNTKMFQNLFAQFTIFQNFFERFHFQKTHIIRSEDVEYIKSLKSPACKQGL